MQLSLGYYYYHTQNLGRGFFECNPIVISPEFLDQFYIEVLGFGRKVFIMSVVRPDLPGALLFAILEMVFFISAAVSMSPNLCWTSCFGISFSTAISIQT
jgi:hypothetical protein